MMGNNCVLNPFL